MTQLNYHGQLGTDLWAAGAGWGRLVAHRWKQAVADTLEAVKTRHPLRVVDS